MKKIFTLIITLSLIALHIKFPLTLEAIDDDMRTINAEKNYVLAIVDEVIDTTKIQVEGSFGTVTLDQTSLSSDSSDVIINPQSLIIQEKGVFQVNMTYNTYHLSIFFITKLSSDTEYVIYEENFDTYVNGALPSQFTMLNNVGQPGGSAAISNQRLMLSPGTIVLFPSYLQSFSNYIIEADMRMTAANDARRWTSIVYRYETEKYYQMAIRQDAAAADGVEFARRNDGAWSVPAIGSFSEALNPATTYQLKVDLYETTVKQFINNTQLIEYGSLYEYNKGKIGVQADNVTVYYDNIKITLPDDYISEDRYEFTQIVDVYQPTTNIVAPATTLIWFNHLADLEIASDSQRPATMIFRVNEELDILDNESKVISNVLDVLIGVNGRIIPAFYTNDVATAESLATFLSENRILDVFIISESSEAILAARAIHNVLRGVKHYPLTDVEELSHEDLMYIRRETNSAQAVASILPSHLLTRDLVFYMQQRLMTVWASSSDDQRSLLHTILTGVHGIVAQDYEEIFNLYQIFPTNTHVRKPLLIAHRGLFDGGAMSPENTIESGLIALEKGADILEIDVHITNDAEVVVIHDTTTARTAPDFDSLTISSSQLSQLKSIYLRDPQSDRTDILIPTLREFLTAFKGTGIVIFIEIKPNVPLLNFYVREIVEELDMYDQSVVITFGQQNIRDLNEYYPEMANGWLNSSVLNAEDTISSLLNMISSIVPINATLNPNYSPLTAEFAKQIIHRGLTVWPWTLNSNEALLNYYNYGVGGMTTDFIAYFENTFNQIHIEEKNFNYVINRSDPFTINTAISTSGGLIYPIRPTYTVIDPNETGLTFDDNGSISNASQPGTAYAYTVFSSSFPNGALLNLASELITVHIRNPFIYTISFETDEGTAVDDQMVEEDHQIVVPSHPSKVGYTFEGWYLDQNFTQALTQNIVPTDNMVIYAKWDMITYTVSFVTQNNTEIDPITINFGESVTLPDQPLREGYTFEGWYLDQNYETRFDESMILESHTTLYAKWSPVPAITTLGIVGIVIGSVTIISGGIFISLHFIKLRKYRLVK